MQPTLVSLVIAVELPCGCERTAFRLCAARISLFCEDAGMTNITFISGLFRPIRGGIADYSKLKGIIREISDALELNLWYRSRLVCYADSKEMAEVLLHRGCYVHRIFDDAPEEIVFDTVHKMKHWIVLNALREFKNVVWIDWDTYNLKPIDKQFIRKCLDSDTPKFTWIDNYWATVNCAVYYVAHNSIELMERSFESKVEEPNDELLWKSVLPVNVREQRDYWFDDYVVNIWDKTDFSNVTDNTYFLHLKDFSMLRHYKRYAPQ